MPARRRWTVTIRTEGMKYSAVSETEEVPQAAPGADPRGRIAAYLTDLAYAATQLGPRQTQPNARKGWKTQGRKRVSHEYLVPRMRPAEPRRIGTSPAHSCGGQRCSMMARVAWFAGVPCWTAAFESGRRGTEKRAKMALRSGFPTWKCLSAASAPRRADRPPGFRADRAARRPVRSRGRHADG